MKRKQSRPTDYERKRQEAQDWSDSYWTGKMRRAIEKGLYVQRNEWPAAVSAWLLQQREPDTAESYAASQGAP